MVYICDTITALNSIIDGLNSHKTEPSNVYIVPKAITTWTAPSNVSSWEDYEFDGQVAPKLLNYTLNKPTAIDNYVPVNQKLLTFPYNYLIVSNNSGSSTKLKFEHFTSSDCEFDIYGVPTCGGSIQVAPLHYEGNELVGNESYKLFAGKYPILNWSTDNYAVWLSQNALNLNIGIGGGIAQMVLGSAMIPFTGGSSVSNAVGGLSQVLDTMKEDYLHSLEPESVKGNINGGDITTALYNNTFYFNQWSIKEEYARKIDKYFSMYGYKVNERKIPNITGRLNFNYVKTIESIVESNVVPDKYLNEFKSMLNSGISFWHNPQTFLDYSQPNPIV